jgi:hypothetical protein
MASLACGNCCYSHEKCIKFIVFQNGTFYAVRFYMNVNIAHYVYYSSGTLHGVLDDHTVELILKPVVIAATTARRLIAMGRWRRDGLPIDLVAEMMRIPARASGETIPRAAWVGLLGVCFECKGLFY